MSLTATNPESQRDASLLEKLLHQREYHLAELIDEVVFAEQERFKAVQEAYSVRELATHLENAFDKLLRYHITMHKEVLLPALVASFDEDGVKIRRTSMSRLQNGETSPGGDNVDGDNAEVDTTTPSNDFLNDLLNEPQLSRETKQLLQAIMQQRKGRGAVATATLSAAPLMSSAAFDTYGRRPPADANEVAQSATRRAILLSDSLLKNQETLVQLLRSIQAQAEDLLDRSPKKGNATVGVSTSHPVVTARLRNSNMVRTPSKESASEANPVAAPFRLENLHQHSDRARKIEEALRKVEAERDALQTQLLERKGIEGTKSMKKASPSEKAWEKERLHLKQELAYAQQRALEEQARCRELRKQVAQLEQIAATSPISPSSSSAIPTVCVNCEKAREELKRKAANYHNAKAAWKAEEERLNKEVKTLQRCVEEAETRAVRAVAEAVTARKERSLVRSSLPLLSPPSSTKEATAEPPRYPAGQSSERKIGQLEATVAALKADIQIMEMRLAVVQDEREAERRRLLAAHEQERERLQHEKDECQKIIDKMSRELQILSSSSKIIPATTSASSQRAILE